MASANDVPIVKTPKGVRVNLQLYLYPDGHAEPRVRRRPDAGFDGPNLPLDEVIDIPARAHNDRQAHGG